MPRENPCLRLASLAASLIPACVVSLITCNVCNGTLHWSCDCGSALPATSTGAISQSPNQYDPDRDPTLTTGQASRGGFWERKNSDFRARSNLTVEGYSSGYHEALVTTDTHNFLSRATDLGNGLHCLPTTGGSGFWAKKRGKMIYSENLEFVRKYEDGFRTDTAQTILCALNDMPAGHAGSGLRLTGQKDAHDLLREFVYDLLILDPATTRGWSEESFAVAAAGVVISSIAPGEVARRIPGGTARLKAGDNAKDDYEINRNDPKKMVDALFQKLDQDGQEFANSCARRYLKSTLAAGSTARHIPDGRATTPERKTGVVIPGEVAGGPYDTQASSQPPDQMLPTTGSALGLGATQGLRGRRR